MRVVLRRTRPLAFLPRCSIGELVRAVDADDRRSLLVLEVLRDPRDAEDPGVGCDLSTPHSPDAIRKTLARDVVDLATDVASVVVVLRLLVDLRSLAQLSHQESCFPRRI